MVLLTTDDRAHPRQIRRRVAEERHLQTSKYEHRNFSGVNESLIHFFVLGSHFRIDLHIGNDSKQSSFEWVFFFRRVGVAKKVNDIIYIFWLLIFSIDCKFNMVVVNMCRRGFVNILCDNLKVQRHYKEVYFHNLKRIFKNIYRT